MLATGTTTIDNAAREPEIADLAAFLNAMGAQVSGAGRLTITIVGVGVDQLVAVDHNVMADRIEAATFLAALGVAGGEITLVGARADHMDMFVPKMGEMGMHLAPTAEGISAQAPERLTSVDVSTLPYPGLATDYKPFFVAMLVTADGVGIVTENIFSGRFRSIDELVRMGADIRTEGHHAVVRGRPRLSGAPVWAHDIRAGAALVVAAPAPTVRPSWLTPSTSTRATSSSSRSWWVWTPTSGGPDRVVGTRRRILVGLGRRPNSVRSGVGHLQEQGEHGDGGQDHQGFVPPALVGQHGDGEAGHTCSVPRPAVAGTPGAWIRLQLA